jgi:dephospho-CoA kinase
MKTYGLTGGVASGKSAVAEIFSELGAAVLAADAVARALRAPGTEGHAFLKATFGTVEPRALRALVFNSAEKRKILEAYFHPRIRDTSRTLIAELRARTPAPPYVIYEAALLIETGRQRDFDGLIVVTASMELQRKRLQERDSIDESSADALLASQRPNDVRLLHATQVIENDGDLFSLRQKVIELDRQFRSLSE